ncbi:hypothetical protein CSUI_005278 [Cystoisospora suis]|uniref:Uncharacterized protein n=1 Tax=Cystoisospora suis TaxID=483139 RepID=A0A2C6KUA7_9APIC|nr:hypothetical protein CSUI_005278 [Cystoisospora suis]
MGRTPSSRRFAPTSGFVSLRYSQGVSARLPARGHAGALERYVPRYF